MFQVQAEEPSIYTIMTLDTNSFWNQFHEQTCLICHAQNPCHLIIVSPKKKIYTYVKAKYSKAMKSRERVGGVPHQPWSLDAPPTFHLF